MLCEAVGDSVQALEIYNRLRKENPADAVCAVCSVQCAMVCAFAFDLHQLI